MSQEGIISETIQKEFVCRVGVCFPG